MARRAKMLQEKLTELEREFHSLLLACLKQSAQGRWGLFEQNDHLVLPGAHRHRWPEATSLTALAEEIRSIRSEYGQPNDMVERFLELRSLRGPNVPGEPKLAASFLAEIGAD